MILNGMCEKFGGRSDGGETVDRGLDKVGRYLTLFLPPKPLVRNLDADGVSPNQRLHTFRFLAVFSGFALQTHSLYYNIYM
jgi:hypothetical protein